MSKGNKTEVIIAGKRFMIMSDDEPEYLRKVSNSVDESIRNLISTNKGMSIESAAILSALKFCDDIHKMKDIPKTIDEKDRLMQQIVEYSKELSEIGKENKGLKKQIIEIKEDYQRQINQLKSQIK